MTQDADLPASQLNQLVAWGAPRVAAGAAPGQAPLSVPTSRSMLNLFANVNPVRALSSRLDLPASPMLCHNHSAGLSLCSLLFQPIQLIT